jgi:hypothetical protein
MDTPAEDISEGLMELGFDIMSVQTDDIYPSVTVRGNATQKPPLIPHHLGQNGKISRDLPTDSPLPHCNQGKGV